MRFSAALVALTLLSAAAAGDEANLAKGRPAQASSEETGKGNLAARAVDGDPGTRWCAASGALPQSLRIDLGAEKRVRALRVLWENPAGSYRYVVESSVDGKAWSGVVDASKPTKPNGVAEHAVDVAAARHLRVTCSGTSGGWASVCEFEAYEGALPPPAKGPRKEPADLLSGVKAPAAFDVTLYARPPEVNYPVCVTAAPTGEPLTLVKSRIEARRDADLSMMPEGLVAALSPREVASLLAYLETLKSKP